MDVPPNRIVAPRFASRSPIERRNRARKTAFLRFYRQTEREVEPALAESPGRAAGADAGTLADVSDPTASADTLISSRSRRRWVRHVLSLILAVGLAVLAFEAIAGRRDELAGATSLIEHIHWGWVAVALPIEFGSIIAFAALEQLLLDAGGLVLRLSSLTGIALAGNAIQNSLPGGVAWSSVFAFRQFRRRGADDVLAAWTMVAVAVLSAASLAGLAAFGLLLDRSGPAAENLFVELLVVLVIFAATAFLIRRRWAGSGVPAAIGAGLIRTSQFVVRRPRGDARALATRTWERLTVVTPSPARWIVAGSFALSNWALDCTCLAIAFRAVGAPLPLKGLLLAYGAGQLAANLPITPGGLGVVEGSLAIALVAYGENRISVVAAVLLYRIISFWVMVPIGWIAWGILTARGKSDDRARQGATS